MNRFLPFILVLLAGGVAAYLIWMRPKPATIEPPRVVPVVEYFQAERQSPVQLTIDAQGVIHPSIETALTAEVSGRIINVAPWFETGAMFAAGDWLIEVDALPYEAALAEARARVAAAKLALEREVAESEQARIDWSERGSAQVPSLVARAPHLASAEANLRAAEAALRVAERNLERTTVRAPYDGIVREKRSDLGQVISANATVIAVINATSTVEVELPIALTDLGNLSLPTPGKAADDKQSLPKVLIRSEIGGTSHTWHGHIVRTAGAVNATNRMLNIIAEVDDPFGLHSSAENDKPPLMAGMFVEAEIEGRILDEGAFEIPAVALRNGTHVYVIDATNRLWERSIGIRHRKEDTLFVTEGIEDGDRICTSLIPFFVNGMEVEPRALEGADR